jgi:Zn-dependent protease with chaperone function
MNDYNFRATNVEPWMFRVPYETLALLFTLLILFVISFVLYSFNITTFLLLLIGTVIYVQLQQAQYLGNAIRIHDKQFPEIFEIFKKQAENLNIDKASIYIIQDPYLQAYTLGITKCTIVLTSALIEQLNEKELSFVIGHELGHFKAGHTKLSTIFNPLGTNNILTALVFGIWNRKTEYSSDRCGLIMTRDIDSAISALIKISIGGILYAKLNMSGYVAQIKTAEQRSVKLSELLVDHPLTTNRIKNIMTFWKENFEFIAK